MPNLVQLRQQKYRSDRSNLTDGGQKWVRIPTQTRPWGDRDECIFWPILQATSMNKNIPTGPMSTTKKWWARQGNLWVTQVDVEHIGKYQHQGNQWSIPTMGKNPKQTHNQHIWQYSPLLTQGWAQGIPRRKPGLAPGTKPYQCWLQALRPPQKEMSEETEKDIRSAADAGDWSRVATE